MLPVKPSKDKLHELVETIRKSPNPEARAAVALVGALLEAAKQKMLSAAGEDLLRTQGEAQCLDRLYKQLTVSHQITKDGFQA